MQYEEILTHSKLNNSSATRRDKISSIQKIQKFYCDIYGDRREAKVTKYKERGKIQPFTSISHEKETDKRVD
jgi:hypothetical protein